MYRDSAQIIYHAGDEAVEPYARNIFWTIGLIVVIIGIIHALSLAFVNDDAFITFRYAENLVRGNGLVYNPGERVEGYTNFLWTILIAIGSFFGAEPALFSRILGITFFSASLLLFSVLSRKLAGKDKNVLYFLPLTSIALALHRDFAVYATSGLETSMYTFFMSATFAILLTAKSDRGLLISGFALVLTALTRPDGIIFYASVALFIIMMNNKPVRSLVLFSLPLIFFFVPYWAWRYSYYGYFFPNTFYAKSIGVPYYSQGFEYIILYFRVYYVFVLIGIIFIYALSILLRRIIPRAAGSGLKDLIRHNGIVPPHILLAGLFCAVHLFFIFRIGGDFMHARFLIPITPLFYFIGEHLLKRLFNKKIFLTVAGIIIVTTIFRNDIFKNNLNVGYVVDESRFYTTEQHSKAMNEGLVLKRYLHNLPVRMAFGPAYLKTAYYSDLPYVLEASTGLTDTFLAHRPLNLRGRPGHEKPASMEYLRQKKIHFYIGPRLTLPAGDLPLNAIVFDTVIAQIVTYDERLMSRLLVFPEIRFNHIPSYIDEYFRKINEYTYAKIMQDYAYMKEFYFLNNEDSTREVKFLGYLKKDNIPK